MLPPCHDAKGPLVSERPKWGFYESLKLVTTPKSTGAPHVGAPWVNIAGDLAR